MSDQSYAYENRQGIYPVSWNEFFGLCKGLAQAIAPYEPDVILGIVRGGLYAATQISHFLRVELYPVKITRRYKDEVVYAVPRWIVKPPPEIIQGSKVLIVDEMSATGETLNLVRQEMHDMGAKAVQCATLYAHESGKDAVDYTGIITDQLVLNPWDREILKDGEFVFHPEYVSALELQQIAPDSSLLIDVQPVRPAKSQ